MTLRPARASETGDLVAFWAAEGENDSRPPDDVAAVGRLLDHDPDALIVAELDGRIVGTIIAGCDGWRANLYRLAVDPEERGAGLGRTLVDAAERRLAALGASRLCAMVLDDNELGRTFWSTVGLEPQSDWSRWVREARSGAVGHQARVRRAHRAADR